MASAWPLRVRSSLPVAASQSLTVESSPPEARTLPSGANTTANTDSWCPFRAKRSFPESRSHRITARRSSEAIVLPSRENTTLRPPPSPVSVRSSLPPPVSHILIVLSQLPETSVLPSGENAKEATRSVCPVSVRSSLPVATSQNLIVLSRLPEASTLASG